MKVTDSVNGTYEMENIKIDLDGMAQIWINRKEIQEGKNPKATIHTNLPTLKEELRDFAMMYPMLVTILVDDPEAEENPEADLGTMQAVLHTTDTHAARLLVNPQEGTIQLTVEELGES